MVEPTTPPAIKGMNPQQAQAYKDATDHLIYLKREQFQVTYYTWLVLAALFILWKQVTHQQPKLILMGGVVMAGLLSVGTLLSFKRSVARFRKRLHFIYQNYFDESERLGFCLDAEEPHTDIVNILMITNTIASLFTLILMLQ